MMSNSTIRALQRWRQPGVLFVLMTAALLAVPVLAHAAEGEEAKPPLIPPLTGPESAQTYMQAVWVIIIFVIMLAVLYPTAWKNVLAGLKKREDRIRGDIAEAEAARAKAEAALRDYTKQLSDAEMRVRDIMAKASADAEKLGQSIRMQAQNESEEIKERATREIEAAKDQAVREVYEQGATLATSVAEKILRRSINPDDQRDLVERALNQMQELQR
ncbi:MAG: F0F1 ATP synthase subunit B [Phycisphaerae bacterium]|nr:F0F1 ATP synthase subunit B [Phycisphaerae bacterium]